MPLRLAIGSEGQIALPARQAEALDLAAGAEVDLSRAGLIAPAGGGAAWIAGTLAALSFAEVAHLVSSGLRTGVLLLVLGNGARRRKAVHFRDGQVVFASSSDPGDRLGPVLVRAGAVSEEAVQRCDRVVASGRPLGQVLVEQGMLTPARLYECLAIQVKEIFLSLFREESGEFLFREGPEGESDAVRLPERTRDLVLEGLRRAEGVERHAAPPAPAPPLPAAEEPARAAPPGPRGPFEAYRRLLRAVFARVRRAVPDAEVRLGSWFDRVPPAQRPFYAGVGFGTDGDVDTGLVLRNVEAAGSYRGAAARAKALESLEALLTFALFEARNVLSRDEAEQLRLEVHRIQMGG